MAAGARQTDVARAQGLSPALLGRWQRQALAEIDSSYKAKIAEREVFLQSQIQKAIAARDAEEVDSLRVQLGREVRRLQEECEEKKAKAR